MTARNPAVFFMATWVPYLTASIAVTGWIGFIDLESVLFGLAAATSLAGLLTLVHEVELLPIAPPEAETAVSAAAA
jgi:hypothetical protein